MCSGRTTPTTGQLAVTFRDNFHSHLFSQMDPPIAGEHTPSTSLKLANGFSWRERYTSQYKPESLPMDGVLETRTHCKGTESQCILTTWQSWAKGSHSLTLLQPKKWSNFFCGQPQRKHHSWSFISQWRTIRWQMCCERRGGNPKEWSMSQGSCSALFYRLGKSHGVLFVKKENAKLPTFWARLFHPEVVVMEDLSFSWDVKETFALLFLYFWMSDSHGGRWSS